MGDNIEPMSTVIKQATLVSIGFLVFFALIGLIPATGAYSDGWKGYWGWLLAIDAFIWIAFVLGTKLSRPKGFKEPK